MAKNAREGNAHPTEIATQQEKIHGNFPHMFGELNTLKVAMTSTQHETDMIGSRIDDKLAHLQQKVVA